MANRKEDERNERAIRSLLKLPDNRRCINCNSLGPQYVCTNFWTFVCTTCSGIHREFTHRVKSVSMAKFTSQEVSALQGGGNASAKEIYFKEWDQQRQSTPDGSNVEKLRDFIKHVYVDRRFTGERSFDKPPRAKTGEAEDSNETRRIDTYQGGSRSPPYEDTYERRYSDRPSPGGRSDDRSSKNSYDERRSPGYEQDGRQYGDYRKSPARTEIVNDWRREDRFGNGRRSEDSRNSDGGSRLEARSPDSQRDLDISSPPMVRPVRDILGENASPLRVIIEPPKANGGRSTDGSMRTQRTASSSSLASSNGNPAELRSESSLIDFDAVPEPPSTAPLPQTQPAALGPSVAQPTTSSNANWANFDSFSEVKVSPAPSNANLLESVLSELSFPAPLPGNVGASVNAPAGSVIPSTSNPPVAPMGTFPVSPFGGSAPAAALVSHSMAFPPAGAAPAAPGQTFTPFLNAADAGQWHNVHPQQHFLPANSNQLPAQSLPQAVGGPLSNQPWNSSLNPNPNTQVPSAASAPLSQVTSGTVTPVQVRPTVKQELPEDLFTTNYSSFPAPNPGWYAAPQYGMGFNPQYNIVAPLPTPTFPQSSKSSNPFDVHNEPTSAQATTFPSMGSLQGALPNVAAPAGGILRTSSLGTPQPTWMSPQSSHPSAMPPQAQSYAPAMPLGSYMGQVPLNMPPRQQQGVVGFGFETASFGPLHPNQHQTGLYSAPATPNTFSSVGGNPFG